MTMKNNFKIGYSANSIDFSAPADARRFCNYAKIRGVRYKTLDPDINYDLIILNLSSDLTLWKKKIRKRKKTIIIFELIDSLLSGEKKTYKSTFRGLAKFVSRKSKYFE